MYIFNNTKYVFYLYSKHDICNKYKHFSHRIHNCNLRHGHKEGLPELLGLKFRGEHAALEPAYYRYRFCHGDGLILILSDGEMKRH